MPDMLIVFFAGFVFGIGFCGLMFRFYLAFDSILRFLYRNRPEIWKSLGRPRGWQWVAPGRFQIVPAFDLAGKWIAQTPDWAVESSFLIEKLTIMRRTNRLAFQVFFPAFAICLLVTMVLGLISGELLK